MTSSSSPRDGAHLSDMDRRTLLAAFALAPFAAPLLAGAADAQQAPPPAAQHSPQELAAIPNMMGSEEIAMLLYPGFTALDFVAPQYFFAGLMGAKVHLVTNQETLDPVVSDTRLAITPTKRLADMSAKIDVIFVPGGSQGTVAAMQHKPTLDFLRARAPEAKLTTSVCTGSMVLAAAGLLKGKKATTHWVAHDLLGRFGATAVDARVVKDGAVITGAGVSAGLDLAISIVEALRGRPYAAALMLQAEYAPQPPFKGGTPAATDPAILATMRGMFNPLHAAMQAVADRA